MLFDNRTSVHKYILRAALISFFTFDDDCRHPVGFGDNDRRKSPHFRGRSSFHSSDGSSNRPADRDSDDGPHTVGTVIFNKTRSPTGGDVGMCVGRFSFTFSIGMGIGDYLAFLRLLMLVPGLA